MNHSVRRWYEELQVDALLQQYSGLRLVPSRTADLFVMGELHFTATGPKGLAISDCYALELRIPSSYPQDEPLVRETGGRIPRDFHKLEGDFLCLGSPTAIRMSLARCPAVPAFVELFVIPYLYGHSYREKHGTMPYGELAHGAKGVRDDLADMFRARSSERPEDFLRLSGMQKRRANKQPCPCNSGHRLGRCHNRRVNYMRQRFGRKWFDAEYRRIVALLESLKAK